jgi:hypothetical protein
MYDFIESDTLSSVHSVCDTEVGKKRGGGIFCWSAKTIKFWINLQGRKERSKMELKTS